MAEPAGAITSAISSCNAIDAGGDWWNQDFPEQTGSFTVDLDATPSEDALDAVVGLGADEAASFAALAVIVRFNDAGMVDVRDGSGYRADTAYAYAAGHRYHVQIKGIVSGHRYSVAIREDGADYTTIATSYAFRTEQASVTRLAHAAGKVDSASGSLDVCGVSVLLATSGTCMTVHAGDGIVSVPLQDATGYETLVFTAQPSGTDVDAVFGLSAGPATSFSDLATAVRFAPTGKLDVRDGDGYRADMSLVYSATPARMWMVSDLSTHTYSVFSFFGKPVQADVFELARQFRFRTEQADVTHLDHLSAVVDGDHGSAIICASVSVPSDVRYSREGRWTVAPLASDDAVMTDGATTTRVDAAGHVLGTVDASGLVATDTLGNAYLARIASDVLTVEKYGPPLALAWRTTSSVATSSSIRAIAGLPDGSAAVAVGTFSGPPTIQVLRFAPDGSIAAALPLPGSAVAIDGDRTVTVRNDNGTLRIAAYTPDGAPIWERAFAGRASITAMALEPDHEVVFGGNFQSGIDFGSGPLMAVRTEDGLVDGFVAKLSSTGEHVFSTRLDYNSVTGIATNGVRTAVSGTRRTQFFYMQLKVFDADHAPSIGAQLFDNGRGGPVAMSPSGRIWWSFEEQFYLFAAFPYLLAYGPGR